MLLVLVLAGPHLQVRGYQGSGFTSIYVLSNYINFP